MSSSEPSIQASNVSRIQASRQRRSTKLYIKTQVWSVALYKNTSHHWSADTRTLRSKSPAFDGEDDDLPR